MKKKGPRRQRERRTTQAPSTTNRRDADRRSAEERRTAVRVPVDLWMEEVHGDEIYFRRSCNISEGGVFFDQSIPYPIGTNVTLRFALPGSNETREVSGTVVSAAHQDAGLGMGLKFDKMSAEVKKAIREHVAALAAKRGTL